MIRLRLNTRLARGLMIGLECAAFLVLTARIARNWFAAYIAEQHADAASLQRAIGLDPGNAEYHLRLARVALYSISEGNPGLAVEHLRQAAALSPRNTQVWLELAAALGIQAETEEAQTCLRRADFLAPQIPAIQWVVGNFYLLQGNTDESLKHFRITLNGDHKYDGIVFRTAWKALDNGDRILRELIPDDVDAYFSYLGYLLGADKMSETPAVWKRIVSNPEQFEVRRTDGFMNLLLKAHMLSEADQVWNDLRAKGLISPIYRPTDQNLIINGNLEEEILNLGYDWRIVPFEGVQASIDSSSFHSPSHALKVKFLGKANVAYGHVYQVARVAPKQNYRLQAFMKTEGVTTASGPLVRVVDNYDPSQLMKLSDSVTGTTQGWNQIVLDFTTGPKTELITVSLARLPSTKLDNLITGTVWLDDVSIAPLP